MKLQKVAHITIPEPRAEWMTTHLANPIVKVLNSSLIRVYCNVRNQNNQTQIIYLEINMMQDFQISYFHQEPLLKLGPAGAFDDNGQSLGCVVTHQGKDYLYFMGWNLAPNVPFRNSIGLAVGLADQNKFEKISIGPVLDRSKEDPFCLSYPYIMQHDGIFKMWYGSHTISGSTVTEIRHSIKYAESVDLIHWDRKNIICLEASEIDTSFTRPFVMFEGGKFRMWYSYLRKYYRIGYAESQDGKQWSRMDGEVGIDVSSDGWDAEMIEYPFIFDWNNERYLAYCGNQFGKSGFGLAKFIK